MEINQRTENELLFRCNCGGRHFLSFSYMAEEDGWREFWVNFIGEDYSLWYRIKTAWQYIIKGKRLCVDEIGLTADDCRRIAMLMGEYIDEVEELEAGEGNE